jgi:hypothetical protein
MKWINDTIFKYHKDILSQVLGCRFSNIQRALKKNLFKNHNQIKKQYQLPLLEKGWKYSMHSYKYFHKHANYQDILKIEIPKFFTKDQKQIFRKLNIYPDKYSFLQFRLQKIPLLCESFKIGVIDFLNWLKLKNRNETSIPQI